MPICLLGCLLSYLVKSLLFNGTIFEQITAKQCPPHLGIPVTSNHLVSYRGRREKVFTSFSLAVGTGIRTVIA